MSLQLGERHWDGKERAEVREPPTVESTGFGEGWMGEKKEEEREADCQRFLTRLLWALGHGWTCSRTTDTTVQLALLCLSTHTFFWLFVLSW